MNKLEEKLVNQLGFEPRIFQMPTKGVKSSHITDDVNGLYNRDYRGYTGHGRSHIRSSKYPSAVPLNDMLLSKFSEWYGGKVRKTTVKYIVSLLKRFGWILNSVS